jgi:hypothetical protein
MSLVVRTIIQPKITRDILAHKRKSAAPDPPPIESIGSSLSLQPEKSRPRLYPGTGIPSKGQRYKEGFGAGDGNRTHIGSLEGYCPTFRPRPLNPFIIGKSNFAVKSA